MIRKGEILVQQIRQSLDTVEETKSNLSKALVAKPNDYHWRNRQAFKRTLEHQHLRGLELRLDMANAFISLITDTNVQKKLTEIMEESRVLIADCRELLKQAEDQGIY